MINRCMYILEYMYVSTYTYNDICSYTEKKNFDFFFATSDVCSFMYGGLFSIRAYFLFSSSLLLFCSLNETVTFHFVVGELVQRLLVSLKAESSILDASSKSRL